MVETDHEPPPSSVAAPAPGQTPGTAAQRRHQAAQGAIPPFPTRGLDRRAELLQTPWLHTAARTAKHDAPVDLRHLSPLGADLDNLGRKAMLGSDQPWCRLTPSLPSPAPTIDNAHHLEEGGALGFPAIRETAGECSHPSDHLGSPQGRLLLWTRTDIDPEQQPAPHCQGRMDPRSLVWTECRMGFIQLHPGHIHPTHNLAMGGARHAGLHPAASGARLCDPPHTCPQCPHHRRPTADIAPAV